MKCHICKQEIIGADANCDHHLMPAPYGGTCLGCFVFGVEMEKFLIRAQDRAPMGDWTSGWLKEILSNPEKHRDA